MPVSKTDIGNFALAHCGISKTVLDIDTENSLEAKRLKLFYPHCLELMLEMQIWPFAKEEFELQLLSITPPDDWEYAYKYPNTTILGQKIKNPAARTELPDNRIPFEIRNIPSVSGYGKMILTDEPNAILIGNRNIEDVNLMTAMFREGFSLLLAAHIAKPLRADPMLAQDIRNQFTIWAGEAATLALREGQEDPEKPSEYESARF